MIELDIFKKINVEIPFENYLLTTGTLLFRGY